MGAPPRSSAQALERRSSVVVAREFSCLEGTWDLPVSGIKPVFPELADGFLTSGLPGKFIISFDSFFFLLFTFSDFHYSDLQRVDLFFCITQSTVDSV